jgi:FixJ family two-component response regulator
MPKSLVTVAIIDDDDCIRSAIDGLLALSGYDTELYASAEAFLAAAATSKAACLVVDIQLGDSCGLELGRRLVAAGFNFPTIYMTGGANETMEREAMAAGCVAFLRKPFTVNLLIEALAGARGRGAATAAGDEPGRGD